MMDVNDYLVYGFTFVEEEGLYSAISDDSISGATQGGTYDKAYDMAQWLIRDNANSNYMDLVLMPKVQPVKEGMVAVNIGYDSALKIMLRNLLIETKTDEAKLAKLMKVTPKALTKIMRFDKATKVEMIARAFEVLGHPLKISCA